MLQTPAELLSQAAAEEWLLGNLPEGTQWIIHPDLDGFTVFICSLTLMRCAKFLHHDARTAARVAASLFLNPYSAVD